MRVDHPPAERGGAAAGRIYLVMALVGEVLLLAAFVIIVGEDLNLELFRAPLPLAGDPHPALLSVLLLVGFGIKAGAFLLHLWLPLAHPVAPTPASAVPSRAMIKAGVLGWLRFLPLGLAPLPEVGLTCVVLGLTGAYFGVVGASLGLPLLLGVEGGWSSTWPLLGALALAGAGWLLWRRGVQLRVALPPGDLVVLIERAWARAPSLSAAMRSAPQAMQNEPARPGRRWSGLLRASERAEAGLAHFGTIGLLFLLLVLVVLAAQGR